MTKYLILDFGKVLAGPTSRIHWFVTPEFLRKVDIKKIDIDKFKSSIKSDILDRKMMTLEEEYESFYEYYKELFKKIDYTIEEEKIISIAKDFVYNDEKYTLYDNVKEDLPKLATKYTLLLLSDNWPSVYHFLDKEDISKFFTKIYISSEYGTKKEEGRFFDYPIKDFNIQKREAIFIDDNDALLDIAEQKGLEVMLMDREGKVKESKHCLINDFSKLI